MNKALLLFLALIYPVSAAAETIVAQGVAGDMDKHSRSPVLTVSTQVSDSGVKILADAYLQHPDYRRYPLRFDFFINRRLFASQMRSPELTGPVGIDVGSDVATLPFNYAVVVNLVHPTRNFVTAVQGAVFASALAGTFDCTLTLVSGTDEEVFGAEDVQSDQTTNQSFSLSFKAEQQDGDEEILVSGLTQVTGEDAAANLQITRSGAVRPVQVSGTVEMQDGKLESFSLASEDENTVLSCS